MRISTAFLLLPFCLLLACGNTPKLPPDKAGDQGKDKKEEKDPDGGGEKKHVLGDATGGVRVTPEELHDFCGHKSGDFNWNSKVCRFTWIEALEDFVQGTYPGAGQKGVTFIPPVEADAQMRIPNHAIIDGAVGRGTSAGVYLRNPEGSGTKNKFPIDQMESQYDGNYRIEVRPGYVEAPSFSVDVCLNVENNSVKCR